MHPIDWKVPWRAIQFAEEIPGVQNEFEAEISHGHPLYGKGGRVIGRRIDSDDVLVLLNDGTYVNVHLTWSGGRDAFPDKWPAWFPYGSREAFEQAMEQDAQEDGEDS